MEEFVLTHDSKRDEDKFDHEAIPRLDRTASSAGITNASKRSKSKNRMRTRSKSQDDGNSILTEIMLANRDAALQRQSIAVKELSSINLSWEICHFNQPGYRRTYLCWKLKDGKPSPFNSCVVQLYAAENGKDDPTSPRNSVNSATVGSRRKLGGHPSDPEKMFWAGSTRELRKSGSVRGKKTVCPLEIAFLDAQGKLLWKLPLVLIQKVTVFDEDEGAVQLEISMSGRRSSKPRIAEIQDSFDSQKLRYTSSTVEIFFDKDSERDMFGALLSEMIRTVQMKEPDGMIEDLVRIESWLTPRLVDGQISLHKGVVKMKIGLRWQKKFLVLFRTKLIVLDDMNSDRPIAVLNLADAMIRGRTTNDRVFTLRYAGKEDKWAFSVPKTEDRVLWLTAFEKCNSVEFGATMMSDHSSMHSPSSVLKSNDYLTFDDDDKEDDNLGDGDQSTQDLELSSAGSSAAPKAARTGSLNSAPPSLARANTSSNASKISVLRMSSSMPKNDFSYDPILYQVDASRYYSDELDAMLLKSQKNFFAYLHEKLTSLKLPFSTKVPSLSEWTKVSKASFTNRGRRTRVVDTYMEIYEESFERCMHMVKHAYLFCFDDVYHPGNSQISFSFPGFESQIFNVGQCALVPVWNCFEFASEVKSFREDDWTGSLQSVSVAKELMQYTPNLSHLSAQDRKKMLQSISSTAALEQLRSLVIATYLAANVDLIALEQMELYVFYALYIF
jgi:hypothetical protein